MREKSMPAPGCGGRLFRLVGLGLLLVAILLLILVVNQGIALTRMRQRLPAPGESVTLNGRAYHLNCQGSGGPTVLIDAGNGSFSLEWTPSQQELSQTTRVCTFDRPGYGWSESSPDPRDGTQVVTELHELLFTAGEAPPYVLVGHSLGGVHMRLYAAHYPQEVAGLILVDTAYPLTVSPELAQQMQASIGFYQVMGLLTSSGILRILGPLAGEGMLPETAAKLPADLQSTYLELLLDPAQYRTAAAEMEQLPQTFTQTEQLLVGEQPFGQLPLIVLTAGRQPAPGSSPFDPQTVPASTDWLAAGQTLASQSERGEQRVVAESGHLIHLDAPEAVQQAVLDVLAMIREP